MKYLEILHLRSYSQGDKNEAIEAFHELSFPGSEKKIEAITLFRDVILDNDLSIFIQWHGEMPAKRKSPMGLQLAETFSEFGYINHSILVTEGHIPLKARRIKENQ